MTTSQAAHASPARSSSRTTGPTTVPRTSLTAGIAAARGTHVLMADVDDSYALEDIGGFMG